MNPIKLEWQQLKTHELARQQFEDELDQAYVMIDGVEVRVQADNFTTKRF